MDAEYVEFLQLLEEEGIQDLAALVEEMARARDDLNGIVISILSSPHEPGNWQRLIDTLDTWPNPEEIPAALERAASILDTWPAELRIAPASWWNALQDDPSVSIPGWQIVRALITNGSREHYEICRNSAALDVFHVMNVSDAVVPVHLLTGATALEQLRYDFTKHDPGMRWEQLEPIGKLTKLQSLALSLTESGDLSPLQGLGALRDLSLRFALRGDAPIDLSPLAHFSHLETAQLLSETQPFASLEPLIGLAHLTHLTIKHPPADLRPLEALARLAELELFESPPITGIALPPSLQSVRLHDLPALSSLDSFRQLTQLQSLSIYGAPELTDVSALYELPRLSELVLIGTDITEIAHLDRLAALSTMQIQAQPELRHLHAEQEQTALRELVLVDCPLLNDITGVRYMRGLNRLVIRRVAGLSDLTPLAGLPALHEIILDDCPDLANVAGLAKIPALREVQIRDCPALGDLSYLKANQHIHLVVE